MSVVFGDTNSPLPAIVPLPGEIIADELDARGWTQADLADIMGRPLQAINEIIRGAKQITPSTAMQLSQAFGNSAEQWIRLEMLYRLWLARSQTNSDIAIRSSLYSIAPIREMVKRGWVPDNCDLQQTIASLCAFYNVTSLDNISLIKARYRQSRETRAGLQIQHTWLQRTCNLASKQNIQPFTRQTFKVACDQLEHLMTDPMDINQIPTVLAKTGIRFVIVPNLPGAYIDGAVTYLNGLKSHPIVALTLRFDRIDNFWFTLWHELAHIALGHSGTIIDELDSTGENKQEKDADLLAAKFNIPEEPYTRFRKSSNGRYTRKAVETFATEIHRHPGIVVGQLHRDGMAYSNMRNYLLKVRDHLKPFIDTEFAETHK